MAYTLKNEFVWKEIGQQVVILQFESGAYWTLNETASVIWKSLLNGMSVDQIADTVASTFDIDAESARNDVLELVKNCEERKILAAA